MKDYEILLKELEDKDYTLLRWSVGPNDYGPFEDIVKLIKEATKNLEGRMVRSDRPPVIIGEDFRLADGTYLVNEDHLHVTPYIHVGESWFKLKLDNEIQL